MRRTRKRIAVWATVALTAAMLSLLGTVSASAHDGRLHDDGGSTGETRGHDHAQDTRRGDDGGKLKAEGPGQALLRTSLAPSVPSDPPIHGVVAGGAPWVLDRGDVELKAGGRLHVKIRGLVIPVAHGTFPAGTARPLTVVSASLYCAPDTAAAVATTKSVPISADGKATIDDTIGLPSTCLAPVVLVHPNETSGVYIAVTGWRS